MRIRLGDSGTLLGRATRALGWSFFNTALARLGTLGIGIFLARLLGPDAFGTFAVAFVAMVALLSFNDLGVSLAIVRWPGEPSEIAPTVATISVVTSVILYVGCFVGAPAFSTAMGAPSAAPVIRVLALNVVISGVVAVPNELLQRYFRQDRKMIADQVNNWVGAGVSVGLAWSGFGAMSLGIGQLAGGLAAGVIFVAFSPLPLRFGFDVAKARALLGFGMPLAGASAIVFLVGNVDNLVVGHLLGATALGFYVLAWNLASWPVNMFSQPMRSVAPALFSRLQHDPAAMRAGFLSAASLLGSVTLPICLLVSGSAVPLLEFVYGARWEPASRALVWLGVLAALRILFELIYDYFVVLARSRSVLTVEILWLLVLIPSLIAGARTGGIFGVGVADVAVAACVVLPWYLRELNKVGIQRRALAARLWLPLATAAGVGVAAAVVSRVIPSRLAELAVSGLVALAAVGLLVYMARASLASLRTTVGESQPVGPAVASTIPLPTLRDAVSSAQARQNTAEALRVLLSMAVPVFPSMSSSISARTDVTGPLPLYQETVASLQWDPTKTRHRGRHTRHGPEYGLPAAAGRPARESPARAAPGAPRGLNSVDPHGQQSATTHRKKTQPHKVR
jgi:O-antigen/teichoic acid export membrane protein